MKRIYLLHLVQMADLPIELINFKAYIELLCLINRDDELQKNSYIEYFDDVSGSETLIISLIPGKLNLCRVLIELSLVEQILLVGFEEYRLTELQSFDDFTNAHIQYAFPIVDKLLRSKILRIINYDSAGKIRNVKYEVDAHSNLGVSYYLGSLIAAFISMRKDKIVLHNFDAWIK